MHSTIFTFITFLGLSAAAAVVPRQDSVCGPTYTPNCCQTDILGVADLNCRIVGDVTTLAELQDRCEMDNSTPECCAIPVAGQALLCNSPV
ncbi:hypothetical protein CFE70_000112 [Pyrenophora teres f. teres 0-1]|uniref:Hydrophobin n=2 Tax=Pyrenophora teres f. teres TaxID=97479 RepID=E3S728_PYRTT|nr:hypothetical protein PTT_18594 [Pyrenophora teres f. teres 0-1]KAE8836637.1 hypothetical protein HRS9139_04735 [Pyrenophora teres f. teres]KAE8837390.1 hypothetical protein PTNB85_04725 [Pyrenophora teres f. teres]KAE8840188.1 hypothetical protein HRS9122_06793 [Pyrenophora teres f. teres]KAE8862216.1 hypothetical protein PTNB29_04778 [Pyrenophora teres f. teres]